MAVKKCKDCGGQVSSKAKACPHCGKPQGPSSFRQLLYLALVGLVVVYWMSNSGSDRTSTRPQAEPAAMTEEERAAEERRNKILAARHACRQAITRRLHDPSSASWTPGFEWPVSVDGDLITVQPSLRATNAFGGTVSQSFTCTVDASSPDGQRVVGLE